MEELTLLNSLYHHQGTWYNPNGVVQLIRISSCAPTCCCFSSQGRFDFLGCRFGPWLGQIRGNQSIFSPHIDVSLSLRWGLNNKKETWCIYLAICSFLYFPKSCGLLNLSFAQFWKFILRGVIVFVGSMGFSGHRFSN